MIGLTGILTFFRKYWVETGVVLAFCLVFSTIVGLKQEVEDNDRELDQYKVAILQNSKKLEDLNNKYNNLVVEAAAREARLKSYYTGLLQLEQSFRNTQALLNNLKQQESQAAKNPKEYTAKLQKIYNDSEREFSCLTGNLPSCSPL